MTRAKLPVNLSKTLRNKHGVYFFLNTTNNRMYIGCTMNLYERVYAHVNVLGRNKHECERLQLDWNEHGATAFEFDVLGFLGHWLERQHKHKIRLLEDIFIRVYQSDNPNFGYNVGHRFVPTNSPYWPKGYKPTDLDTEANIAARRYRLPPADDAA